ncbi:GNAT family N-acetyltransferase [Caldifermentibacillus hisashii]|jgi:ribosomal protein S18 acetylase RimI-like enzyme|uniref:GNAT family N-acetyltransferase n=2 Tax=Bacillales TaxID=1385 RepID=UPI00288AF2D7|nr:MULTISPECIES: GNAT family N-acetyltransferase [Bacillaceae]
MQGRGMAKELLRSLERYAVNNGIPTLSCRVRLSVPRNIQLYQSLGYEIYDEEVIHKPNEIQVKVVLMKKILSTSAGISMIN